LIADTVKATCTPTDAEAVACCGKNWSTVCAWQRLEVNSRIKGKMAQTGRMIRKIRTLLSWATKVTGWIHLE
jgi:hypothetical protein